jgi:hypothetical protein
VDVERDREPVVDPVLVVVVGGVVEPPVLPEA